MERSLHQEPAQMHPLIEHNLDAIREICREFGVEKLEVFGSIMAGDFTDDSDVDFIVHFPEGYDFGPWGSQLFDFEKALAKLLRRDVDVVMTSALRNKWFKRAADKTRTELFDASQITEVA